MSESDFHFWPWTPVISLVVMMLVMLWVWSWTWGLLVIAVITFALAIAAGKAEEDKPGFWSCLIAGLIFAGLFFSWVAKYVRTPFNIVEVKLTKSDETQKICKVSEDWVEGEPPLLVEGDCPLPEAKVGETITVKVRSNKAFEVAPMCVFKIKKPGLDGQMVLVPSLGTQSKAATRVTDSAEDATEWTCPYKVDDNYPPGGVVIFEITAEDGAHLRAQLDITVASTPALCVPNDGTAATATAPCACGSAICQTGQFCNISHATTPCSEAASVAPGAGGERGAVSRARTCADTNADGMPDNFNCAGETNSLKASPAGIICAADPCTADDCCTVSHDRTCADTNADGSNSAFDCAGETNSLNTSPAGIICAADPCTADDCCTVPRARTCADTNADGSNSAFNCAGETNSLNTSPAGIICAADPCTADECCTPTGALGKCGSDYPEPGGGSVTDADCQDNRPTQDARWLGTFHYNTNAVNTSCAAESCNLATAHDHSACCTQTMCFGNTDPQKDTICPEGQILKPDAGTRVKQTLPNEAGSCCEPDPGAAGGSGPSSSSPECNVDASVTNDVECRCGTAICTAGQLCNVGGNICSEASADDVVADNMHPYEPNPPPGSQFMLPAFRKNWVNMARDSGDGHPPPLQHLAQGELWKAALEGGDAGSAPPAANLTDCKTQCRADDDCLGIHWIEGTSSGSSPDSEYSFSMSCLEASASDDGACVALENNPREQLHELQGKAGVPTTQAWGSADPEPFPTPQCKLYRKTGGWGDMAAGWFWMNTQAHAQATDAEHHPRVGDEQPWSCFTDQKCKAVPCADNDACRGVANLPYQYFYKGQ